ncbi:uncharacterized protein N7529_004325 [Penicillium soppii]|uniref:uncharacterized protein n=1 Tax=Penicillium soppii TaxID=69789 RepID=UPI002547D791|nr:uncharacterized protein N7529_004325 [Penicillium soppii]KAJ5871972.1 hypothetical protein N7529_004325 [Penicillium soppii]
MTRELDSQLIELGRHMPDGASSDAEFCDGPGVVSQGRASCQPACYSDKEYIATGSYEAA